jgi:hypothetical protein
MLEQSSELAARHGVDDSHAPRWYASRSFRTLAPSPRHRREDEHHKLPTRAHSGRRHRDPARRQVREPRTDNRGDASGKSRCKDPTTSTRQACRSGICSAVLGTTPCRTRPGRSRT